MRDRVRRGGTDSVHHQLPARLRPVGAVLDTFTRDDGLQLGHVVQFLELHDDRDVEKSLQFEVLYCIGLTKTMEPLDMVCDCQQCPRQLILLVQRHFELIPILASV